MRIATLTLAAALLAACGSGRTDIVYTFDRVIPAENAEAAHAMFVEACEAANPKSDEEPEDWIPKVSEFVLATYGRSVPGIHGTLYDANGNYVKRGFTPASDLPDDLRCDVEKWAASVRPSED